MDKATTRPRRCNGASRPAQVGAKGANRAAPHVAIVSTGDAVAFVATASSSALLTFRLANWIGERAPHTLWPRDAAYVRDMLAQGRHDDAVTRYFETVGQRWDLERLTIQALR